MDALTYELGYGTDSRIVVGRGTPYYIASVNYGDPELSVNDTYVPRSDGESFGRDFYGGRTITFEGNILTTRHPWKPSPSSDILMAQACLGYHEKLASAWDGYDIRQYPNKVIPLRLCDAAGRARRVYGRPRKFVSTSGSARRGRIPFSMTFKSVDQLYYDDVESSQFIKIVPDPVGGLIGDLIGDIFADSEGLNSRPVNIRGTHPSWVAFKINGPIQNPDIEVVGQFRFKLLVDIASDMSVIVDPTPWQRQVRRVSDGANYAGKFTQSSPRLSSLRLPPGGHEVILRGNDITKTASLIVTWRDAYGGY